MSTLTAGAGVGVPAAPEAAVVGEAALPEGADGPGEVDEETAEAAGAEEGAAEAADADAAEAPLAFGFVCALAAKEYAASGSTRARTIVTRRRMRYSPSIGAHAPS